MAPFVIDLFPFWCEILTMLARRRKGDVWFAVNVLSDDFFDEQDRHDFSDLIADYFADSGDETENETDNECGM